MERWILVCPNTGTLAFTALLTTIRTLASTDADRRCTG
jgi:hypothetical protein